MTNFPFPKSSSTSISPKMTDTSRSSVYQDDVDNKTVKYGSCVLVQNLWTLPIPISDPSLSVHYRFATKPGDISFNIVFKPNDGDEVELRVLERYPSHIGAATGTISPLRKYGVLFFKFDNSYSWLQGKELSYIIEIRHVSARIVFKYG